MTEEKRCWICLGEELENNDSWIAPCYCKGSVKYTHENCLLRWIYEKQQDFDPVSCQSCGYTYVIQEPFNPLLILMNKVNSGLNSLVPLGIGFLSSIGGYIVAFDFGHFAFYNFVGEDIIHDESLEFQVYTGLPLIPISLILSRFPVPDTFFMLIPMLLFPIRRFPIKLTWPPSPILTLYTLPWIRLIYKKLLNSFLKWDLEREKLKYAGTFQIATVQESQETSILRLSLGALAFPVLSSFIGSMLGLIPIVSEKVPAKFHKSLLGGILLVFSKDITSWIYRKIVRFQRRSRRIQNFHSD